jgi:hypothetical protein
MFPDWIACFGVPAVIDLMSFVAVCWSSFVTVRLCVGVDVATRGKASAVRATWVKIGGIILRCSVSKRDVTCDPRWGRCTLVGMAGLIQ